MEKGRVVIFAGGNDVDSYYGKLYDGEPATAELTATRDNLKWMVDYVRSIKASLPIVLVSVPHLGCVGKDQPAPLTKLRSKHHDGRQEGPQHR